MLFERAGETTRARKEIAIGPAQVAVDDGGMVGEDRGGALEELQRRQRLVICCVAVEIDVVGCPRHSAPLKLASFHSAN